MTYTRLTVIGSKRKADLVLPDDEPVGTLLPQLLEVLRRLKTLQPLRTPQLLRTLQPPKTPALPPLTPLPHNMSKMPGQYRRKGRLMIRPTVRAVRAPMASPGPAFLQGRVPMVTKPRHLPPWLPPRW